MQVAEQIGITRLVQLLCLLGLLLKNVKLSSECDPKQQQFLKYENGLCPSGTNWNETLECCVGCKLCAAGYRKAENCSGHCIPCEEGVYSDQYDNSECFPCRDCTELNRVERSACAPARNTICGQCLNGYNEHPDLRDDPIFTIRCLKNETCVQTEAPPVTEIHPDYSVVDIWTTPDPNGSRTENREDGNNCYSKTNYICIIVLLSAGNVIQCAAIICRRKPSRQESLPRTDPTDDENFNTQPLYQVPNPKVEPYQTDECIIYPVTGLLHRQVEESVVEDYL